MVLTMHSLRDAVVPRRRREPDSDIGPLGRVLLRLRGESGLLQKEIEARSGLAQGYYSNLETGAIRNPGKDKLHALDRAFGLEPGTVDAQFQEERRRNRIAESRGRYDMGRIAQVDVDARGAITALLRDVPDEDAYLLLRLVQLMIDRVESDGPEA